MTVARQFSRVERLALQAAPGSSLQPQGTAAVVPSREEIFRTQKPLDAEIPRFDGSKKGEEAGGGPLAQAQGLKETRGANKMMEHTDSPLKLYGFMPIENPAPKVLSASDIDHYNEKGFVRPIRFFSEAEAEQNRAYFDDLIGRLLALNDGRDSYSINGFHMKCRYQYDIVMHPKILDAVEDLLGPNFFCWGSHFFCKMPQEGRPVPFHQDATYWPFDTSRTCTVWLAIDDADKENAALQFVPGSHREPRPAKTTDQKAAVLNVEVETDGEEKYVNAMRAGEASIHADLLIHGSEPNVSDRRRCGFTIRYCASDCRPLNKLWARQTVHCRGFTDSNDWTPIKIPEGEDISPMTRQDYEFAKLAAQ